ncbi:hypothetical protein FNCP11_12420 [Fusobacterium nucleatum]|nr:hypothetical protein FNCP11_12420 [Fusobacterium nucleatum]BEP10321.1 hypothetical protein FNSP11_11650 [Fusobacterium nucleatum]
MEKNFKLIINRRNLLNKELDETYINMIDNINNKVKELENIDKVLQEDFFKACAMDFAGETVRNFFDMSDYNITVDQLYNRILNFNYNNEVDPLFDTMNTNKKNLYNLRNSKESLENLKKELGEPEKLFNKEIVVSKNGKERKQYEDKNIIENGKDEYRKKLINEGNYKDETGTAKENLEVDHILPLASAGYYKKYLNNQGVQEIKEYYNSEDNFAMLGKTANQCKGDAKVFDKAGNDITYKATPEQITEAIIKKLEGGKNRKEETNQKLKNDGILDENGKVLPNVKRKIEEDIRYSQNRESRAILKNTDYKKVTKDAGKETGKQLAKILAGQVIYYLVPPVIYEIKINLKNESDSENILENLGASFNRIYEYIISKKNDILGNVLGNSIKKFFKNFFDIIIQIVKATIKKLLKMVRQLVITVVDAVKILFDKSKTFLEKMDAILQLITGLVVNIALEVLFEYIEKQFMIPEMFLMPLQMIVSIMATNFVMLSLKKLDLFGTNKKFKIEKIKAIFEEERKKANSIIEEKLINTNYSNQILYNELEDELEELSKTIEENNMFNRSISAELTRIFNIFGKDLDIEDKFAFFLGKKNVNN